MMKCPMCGNEVNQEEVFCGHCGTPNTPPAKPIDMTNAPSLRSGLLGTHSTNTPFTPPPSDTRTQGTQPPSAASGVPSMPNPPLARPAQTGFYRDATEAISTIPNQAGQSYPTGYPQQSFSGSPLPGGYPGPDQFGPPRQPFQTANYAGPGNSMYAQQPPITGQGYEYGMQGKMVPPPQTAPNHMAILVVCISVVVVLISAILFSALFIAKSHPNDPQKPVTTAATAAPTPTPVPTNTPTPIPSPTVAPTPPPDAGFLWCGPTCANNGFSTEYPVAWQPGAIPATFATQFADPAMPTISATFKTPPGATTSTAGDLVTADLANFPGNTPLGAPTTSTISGETWVTSVAMYPNAAQQPMRVAVYATVHQGMAYTIELQAPDDQYDATYAQFFANMLGKFQFLQATQ